MNVIPTRKDSHGETLERAMAFEDYLTPEHAAEAERDLEFSILEFGTDPDFIAEVEALAPCRRV